MTDTQVLAMGVGRRAPRSMKLEKPAPLKRSASSTKIEEKTFQGVRAPRRTNLKKPIPRSKSTSEEGIVQVAVIDEKNCIQRSGMTPNTAKRTADNLIISTLSDLKDRETSKAASVKPRLKSQMSVDSGIGDCTNNNIRTSSFTCLGRHNSLNEVMLDEGFNEYPEDILAIEEELSSFDYSEHPAYSHSQAVGEMKEQFIKRPPYHSSSKKCMPEQEPISYSFCRADDTSVILSPGVNCNLERRESSNAFIQYTADELLTIGMNPLCQKTPKSWEDLVYAFPDVCLLKVDRFNAAKYKEERGYVLENFYIKGCRDIPPMMKTNFSQSRTGFGVPSQKTTDNQANKREPKTECDYSAVERDFLDLKISINQYQRKVKLIQQRTSTKLIFTTE